MIFALPLSILGRPYTYKPDAGEARRFNQPIDIAFPPSLALPVYPNGLSAYMSGPLNAQVASQEC